MNQQYFTLKAGQFIEFTEEGIFFCIRNEGDNTKLIYINIHEIKEKEVKTK